MKKIFLITACLLGFLSLEAKADETIGGPEPKTISISEHLNLVSKNHHEENLEQHFIIDVTYPQIEGENLSKGAENYNQRVSDLVKKETDQFKRYVLADIPHMKALPEEIRKNSFHMHYTVDVIKPKNNIILSTQFEIEGFQAGRAHPYHLHQVLNYDLNNGKVLELKNFFQGRSNYLTVISNYARTELNEKIEDKLMITEGTKPLPKNYRLWNLKSDGIVFIFDEYQVAPYTYGAQKVKIPYEVFKKMISPRAIIYPCVVNPSSC